MIHELRSYRLRPGSAVTYLTLLADEGLPLVTRHLPLLGFWLAETGPLNVLYHLWDYADWAEREAARAGLAAEDGWVNGFVPRAFPLIEEQENRLLRLEHSSPAYDAALAARGTAHPARSPGQPLFAPGCAALVSGTAPGDAVAGWQVVSGRATGPLALMPRRPDPLPAQPTGQDHVVLRPLVFSPL